MKNNMVTLLVFYTSCTLAQSDYGIVQRHNDSVDIYKAYEKEYQDLRTLRETDIETWRSNQAENDRSTACQKLRLQKYNGKPYHPAATFNRPGFGEAYNYPNPNQQNGGARKFCTVYDEQTRFMKNDSTGRMIPYILKIEFTNDSLPLKTKLDPVTYAVLKQ